MLAQEKEIRNLLGLKHSDFGEVLITPEKAKTILALYNSKNRKLSSRTAELYAQDMIKNLWVRSNDSITFDDNWELSNGQHRLMAITLAKKSIKLSIGFNVNQSTEMDRGKQRTIAENIRLSDKVNSDILKADKKVTEIANVLLSAYLKQKKIRTDDVVVLINKYEKHFITCIDNGLFNGANGVGQAGVSATFFVALVSGVPLGTLIHVRRILNSGVSTGDTKDKPIIGLRDKLQAIRGGGGGITNDRIRYTQYGIHAVVNGKTTKVCKCDKDIYKLT